MTIRKLSRTYCALASLVVWAVIAPVYFCYSKEISSSVGAGAPNRSDDVLAVQLLLNQIPSSDGGATPLLSPDGVIGPLTIAAIKRFQSVQFGADTVDGLVAPNTQSIQRLRQLVDAQSINFRIVRIALGERLFWRDGTLTETSHVVSDRLKKYWSSVGLDYSIDQLRDQRFQADHPWSSAFVSWVMKEAGAEEDFAYSAAHWRYVAAAKHNRLDLNDKAFRAYRINEARVTEGDIAVKRRSSSTATYDNIESGHMTHGDIVVEVADGRAVTIGGNVSNSVRTTFVALGEDGKIMQELYFAVVQVRREE